MCGKVSRGPSFDVGAAEGHKLQVLTQIFVGGRGRGMLWTRRDAERPIVEVLEECARAVTGRLRRILGLPPLVVEEPVVVRVSAPARAVARPRVVMPPSMITVRQ